MASEFIFVEELVNIVNCLLICIKIETTSDWLLLLGPIIVVRAIVCVVSILLVVIILLRAAVVVIIIILINVLLSVGSVCRRWTR